MAGRPAAPTRIAVRAGTARTSGLRARGPLPALEVGRGSGRVAPTMIPTVVRPAPRVHAVKHGRVSHGSRQETVTRIAGQAAGTTAGPTATGRMDSDSPDRRQADRNQRAPAPTGRGRRRREPRERTSHGIPDRPPRALPGGAPSHSALPHSGGMPRSRHALPVISPADVGRGSPDRRPEPAVPAGRHVLMPSGAVTARPGARLARDPAPAIPDRLRGRRRVGAGTGGPTSAVTTVPPPRGSGAPPPRGRASPGERAVVAATTPVAVPLAARPTVRPLAARPLTGRAGHRRGEPPVRRLIRRPVRRPAPIVAMTAGHLACPAAPTGHRSTGH